MILRFLELFSLFNRYTKIHNLPVWKTLYQIVLHKWTEDLSLEEQLQSGMYLPAMRGHPEHMMVSRKRMMALLKTFNDYPVDMISDKSLFAYYAMALGAQTPDTFLVFESSKQKGLCHGRTADGTLLTTKTRWIDFLRESLGDKFIIKAALSDGGKGIGLFSRQADGQYLNKDRYYSPEDIYEDVVIKKTYGKCIFQRIAQNHEEITRKTGAKALQCLRILTAKTRYGDVKLYSLWFKFVGHPNNETDHFLLGRTGNFSAQIDNNTRKIKSAFSFNFDRYEFFPITHHPFTGEGLIGWKIPYIDEAADLALKMHRGLSSMQAVGWDIAITPQGPMVVEGNSLWGGSGRDRPYFSYQDLNELMKMIEFKQEEDSSSSRPAAA